MEVLFYHRIRQFLALFLVSVIVLSCGEEIEQQNPINEDLVFSTESDLGIAVRNISLLDGSSDNILDNSNCHKIVFPVSIEYQGESSIIENESDLVNLVDQYNQNPYLGLPTVNSFPVTLRTEDYTTVTVTSAPALEALAATCNTLVDSDIECIDFIYPVKVATYDEMNQLADVVTMYSDEEIYFLLSNEKEGDFLAIQYPIDVIDASGEEETIISNSDFESLLGSDAESCDENDILYDDAGGPVPTLQTLSLQLTDAPFPFGLISEVNINITRVEVKTGEDNDSIPFITIYDTPTTFNMLDLTNGATAPIGSAILPVGNYKFFRMYVDDGNVVMEDGEVFELNVPSGSQTGIKIEPEQNIEVQEGVDLQFLLDFDVSKSLVVRGNPDSPNGINGFNFKPVLRAVNLANTGSIAGVVSDISTSEVLANATVSILAADTLYTTSLTNELGEYRIIGITEGTYDVQVELDGYLPALQEGVNISIGAETSQDFQLTEE